MPNAYKLSGSHKVSPSGLFNFQRIPKGFTGARRLGPRTRREIRFTTAVQVSGMRVYAYKTVVLIAVGPQNGIVRKRVRLSRRPPTANHSNKTAKDNTIFGFTEPANGGLVDQTIT